MAEKRFPLFVSLEGRRAVVLGGGRVGLRRAEALRRFGAEVTVISPAFSGEPEGVELVRRTYREGDFAGAFLALAATDNPEVNAAAGEEAARLGVFFNRADCPEACDFYFPAICEGEGLTVGVAGDGTDHQKTRETAWKIRNIL